MRNFAPRPSDKPLNSRRHFLKSVTGAGLGGAELLLSRSVPSHAAITPLLSPASRKLDPGVELRVGLIGTSGHTNLVLGALPEIPGARLVAFALKDGQHLQKEVARTGYADRFQTDIDQLKKQPAFRQDTNVYETYQEMFSKENLDVVGICLYSLNAFASMAAAERGVHIMSEKPLATEMKDLERLRRVVEKSGVGISAMLEMRLSAGIRTIRENVLQGSIGEPVMATGQKSFKFGKTRPWFYKTRQTFGGTIPWIGIHAIDFVMHTTGLKVKQVAAVQGNKAQPDYPGTEDYAAILLGLSNGGTAVVTLDYFRPDGAEGSGDDRLRLVGTKGVIEMRGNAVELITQQTPARSVPLLPGQSIFADFVASLRGLKPHVLPPGEAFEATRVCLLARQAADERRVIQV